MVCAAVWVTKSVAESPESALMSKPLMVVVGAVRSTVMSSAPLGPLSLPAASVSVKVNA